MNEMMEVNRVLDIRQYEAMDLLLNGDRMYWEDDE